MKKYFLAAAGLFALMAPATAADMRRAPAYKAPPPTPVAQIYDWTGFYIGGHVGGAFSDGGLSNSDARFLGGAQAGFDYQFAPNWVVGIEGQYSFLSRNSGGLAFAPAGVASLDSRGIGSVTGRIGYAFGPVLVYGKGGYAFSDRDLNVTQFGVPVGYTTTGRNRDGYTVGAGLEYLFAPSWSTKVEYQYYDFGRTRFTAGPPALVGASFKNEEHTVKAGVNYRFTWGGPPVPRF